MVLSDLPRGIFSQASFNTQPDSFCRMVRAELAHHVRTVDLDSARTDFQFARDQLVATALSEPIENFTLARGKAFKPVASLHHFAARLSIGFCLLENVLNCLVQPFRS